MLWRQLLLLDPFLLPIALHGSTPGPTHTSTPGAQTSLLLQRCENRNQDAKREAGGNTCCQKQQRASCGFFFFSFGGEERELLALSERPVPRLEPLYLRRKRLNHRLLWQLCERRWGQNLEKSVSNPEKWGLGAENYWLLCK